MRSFCDILRDVGHTDKDTSHSYGRWYDWWFAPLRDRPVNVLEVGVCVFGGGCALSFAEYFQNGTVWAVDIDRSHCRAEVFDHPRIRFLHQDAYQPELLSALGNETFDVIIDDASHEVADQFKLLQMLRPRLRPGAFYVVEDCCTGHWLPRLPDARRMGLRHTLIDMSTATVYDNTLIRFEVAE